MLLNVSVFRDKVPSLFTVMPSCVMDVTPFDSPEAKFTALPVVASVRLLLSTAIAPADPDVLLLRLKVELLPDWMIEAATPRLAELIAAASPARFALLPVGTFTVCACPPPTLMEILPESVSELPTEELVAAALAG